jgi:hypothetical protein
LLNIFNILMVISVVQIGFQKAGDMWTREADDTTVWSGLYATFALVIAASTAFAFATS